MTVSHQIQRLRDKAQTDHDKQQQQPPLSTDDADQEAEYNLPGPVTDAGWHIVGDIDGVPLWQWQDTPMIRVATLDDDILRIIGASLNHCDKLSLKDFNQFITQYLHGGRSGMCSDEH